MLLPENLMRGLVLLIFPGCFFRDSNFIFLGILSLFLMCYFIIQIMPLGILFFLLTLFSKSDSKFLKSFLFIAFFNIIKHLIINKYLQLMLLSKTIAKALFMSIYSTSQKICNANIQNITSFICHDI